MDRALYFEQVGRLRLAAAAIADNVDYLRAEMPGAGFADDARDSLATVCDGLVEALRDTRPEFDNLEDKLGLRAGLPPHDPDIVSPDPRVTMGFIRNWLWEAIAPIDGIVRSAQAAADRDAGKMLASVLLSESAANILRAYAAVVVALDAIADALTPVDGMGDDDLVSGGERRSVLDAGLIRAFHATHYVIDPDERSIVLRIGQRNADVARLLAEADAASAVFITAANPCSRDLPETENARRNALLRFDAIALGANVIAGVGRAADGAWTEQSWFVTGIGREDANRLADRYQQNAYLWVDLDGIAALVLRR